MNDSSAPPFGSRLLGPVDQSTRTLRIRVQFLLTVTLVSANVIGAGIVVVLSVLVIPSPPPNEATLVALWTAVPAYVIAGLVAGGWWGTRRTLATLRWAFEPRRPTDAERFASLRVPLQLTAVQAGLWGIATVAFSALLGATQPALLLNVPATIAFTGAVVCANAHLLGQFALRPVTARALTEDTPDRLVGAGVHLRMLLFWCLGTGVPVAGLMLIALFVVYGALEPAGLAVTVIVLGGVVLTSGLLITVFTARAIVAPIRSVQDAMGRVRAGDLGVEVPVYDASELGLLQAGFNRMAQGLRDRERIRDLFGRHVGEDVAEAALEATIEMGGELREVSVLFVDLVGSTALAAARPPTEVVDLLNRFFSVVVDEVDACRGLVNKFVGDAVLAVFGAPTVLEDHATSALTVARAISTRLPGEVPDAVAGIGVATGTVVAGNVGDRRRFEYTVIGDAVNEAARLTELAKEHPGRLVASWQTVALASPREARRWEASETVTLRGRDRPTRLAVPRAHP